MANTPRLKPLKSLTKTVSIYPLLAFLSCTDAGLQPLPEEIQYVDDKLSISGEFCTSPAEEESFPVKILIVIDQSASLQCTDPGNNRLTALNQAGGSLSALPNVQFGVIGFASWSNIFGFSDSWSDASARLAPESGQGGPATDYQGALSTVLTVLEQDMLDSGPAMRARTKYMVLFLSDGVPEPRCRSGCDDGETVPDSLYGVCNTTEDIPDGDYVDMHSLCPDYNQPEQIMQKVQDIMSLGEFYGVGDLTLNTIFMFSDEINSVCPDAAGQFGYVREEAEPMMRAMADEGRGTFRNVDISTELDFLDFGYESLMTPYEVSEFFAINMNTVPSEIGMAVDSDRDGIDDAREFDLGLSRLTGDSDGDSFSDHFELSYAAKGFDPNDVLVPSLGCNDTSDLDADNIIACEETFLGTDPRAPDSDGDRIPDGIELRLGMNPLIHDTLVDHDFDGRLSGNEVRAGTSPKFVDEENVLLNQVLYSVNQKTAVREDEIRCYDFSVQDITLVPSLNLPGEQKGKGVNRILLFIEEEPQSMAGSRGRYFVACVEARYLGETYKDPPSGIIQNLGPEHFVELPIFDENVHCLKPGENPDGGLL